MTPPPSTALEGAVSRIVPQHEEGSIVMMTVRRRYDGSHQTP